MKKLLVLPLLVASTFAGTESSTKSAKAPILPPPSPDLYSWFAGASGGYLLDNDEAFYSAHVGVDLPYDVWGWDSSVFLEVGWSEFDCNIHADTKKYDEGYYHDLDVEMDFIPITLNYKLERNLTDSLRCYVGAGAGVAMLDLDIEGGLNDTDTVFFAQAFAGVLYEVNESFELFAGGRVIWFDDPSWHEGSTVDLDDLEDCGCDIETFDALIEAGGRINF